MAESHYLAYYHLQERQDNKEPELAAGSPQGYWTYSFSLDRGVHVPQMDLRFRLYWSSKVDFGLRIDPMGDIEDNMKAG